jgi:hypothetical protein
MSTSATVSGETSGIRIVLEVGEDGNISGYGVENIPVAPGTTQTITSNPPFTATVSNDSTFDLETGVGSLKGQFSSTTAAAGECRIIRYYDLTKKRYVNLDEPILVEWVAEWKKELP